jgi:hypothetical protein
MSTNPNIIFALGYLYFDPDGENIPFGELQEATITNRDTTKEARGPSSLYPLAVGISERSATLRASHLKVRAKALQKVLGGDLTYADNKTTLSIKSDSTPSEFKARLCTPSTGEDAEFILYRIKPVNLEFPLKLRDFSIPNFEAQILADEATGKVWDIILPGYQSVS